MLPLFMLYGQYSSEKAYLQVICTKSCAEVLRNQQKAAIII
jgi:hypothetical protein